MIITVTDGLVSRFKAKVRSGGAAECWPWTGTLNTRGYGQLSGGRANGHQPVYVHRLSYFLEAGDWPEQVRHTCDTPGCCNPAHMLPGTPKQNTGDAIERGRLATGDRVRSNKLSLEQVAEIRATFPDGPRRGRPIPGQVTYRELAEKYGVHLESIGAVVRGETHS